MGFLSGVECSVCSATHDPKQLLTVCEKCGQMLVARYHLDRVAAAVTKEDLRRRPPGMYRFRELTPLEDGEEPVTLGEGGTPLLPLARLGKHLGLSHLLAKDEGQNPTGTFKARGLGVAVTKARTLGVRGLMLPSAGNAGGAAAVYGARAGLPVVVIVPRDTPEAAVAEAIMSAALGACSPQRVSFTIEIHQVEGRLPLADAAWLFPHWRDTTNAERMNYWL